MADFARLGIEIDSKGVPVANTRLNTLTKTAGGSETATKNLTKAWASFGKLLIAGGVAIAFRSIIRAVDEGQVAFNQLVVGLESTQNASGQTVSSLVALSNQMQATTRFADDMVQSASAILLSFTNIADDAFPRTIRVAADVATRMGTDLRSAVIQLGKALNDPVQNLGALSRAGIQFSKDQKKVIKELVETNKLAEAQNVILIELERQYAGSAAAARDTLGGAITSLKNSFSDLLEAIGGAGGGLLVQSLKGLSFVFVGLEGIISSVTEKTNDLLGVTIEYNDISNELSKLIARNKERFDATRASAEKYSVALITLAAASAKWVTINSAGEDVDKKRDAAGIKAVLAIEAQINALKLSNEELLIHDLRLAGVDSKTRKLVLSRWDEVEALKALQADTATAASLTAQFTTEEERLLQRRKLALDLDEKGLISHETFKRIAGDTVARLKELREGTEGVTSASTIFIDTMRSAATTLSSTWIDSLFDAEKRSELTFAKMAQDFSKMVAKMLLQQAALKLIGKIFPSAQGNAFSGGNIIPMAHGGIVTQPTIFPMARGAGLMGEAGPEAVMPLTRTSSGDLGVKVEGAAPVVNLSIINTTGEPVTESRRSSAQGVDIEIIVGEAVTQHINKGTFDRSLQGRFGLSLKGISR